MTIFIVDIEAVDTRYTKQWKEHLPSQMSRATNEEVVVFCDHVLSALPSPADAYCRFD